ncbi:hypothetical protein K491DRAFT_698667 [Lophiostoma macrostomum CBS 122681]|uniref:U6 snRNA phosphodiesterase n=1 Tax=Lophiostoma macrostomum CBS 122681 TaxID=1314788 RepID=A0A6A6SMB9_9PLEO|nr:hypothetical protein K491DRAFT_698667 [Lophiostoma macrostomum CBS 122681]
MSLVAYPASDSDDNSDEHERGAQGPALAAQPKTSPTRERRGGPGDLKRKRAEDSSRDQLPPLPAAFHDLYSTNARLSTSDDPSLHGGRKRAVPHVEGNWPSHVYLEWVPSHTESEQLFTLIASVQKAIQRANDDSVKPLPVPDMTPSLRSPLGVPLPLHISLSRTLQIKTEERDRFLDEMTASLRRAAVGPFDINFTNLKWVPNYERNRWFLVLGVERPEHDDLNRLLEACNAASEKCGHPGLYTGGMGDGPMERNISKGRAKRRKSSGRADDLPSRSSEERADRTDNFHISIAWGLIEPAPEWIDLVKHFAVNEMVGPPSAPFDVVKTRIGNTVYSIQLTSRSASSRRGRSILGLG